MICGMASHAGRTRRPRGTSSEEIRGIVHCDVKAYALKVAAERKISLSLFLEEAITQHAEAARTNSRFRGEDATEEPATH